MLILLFLKGGRIMGLSARDATPAWRLAVSNLWMARNSDRGEEESFSPSPQKATAAGKMTARKKFVANRESPSEIDTIT